MDVDNREHARGDNACPKVTSRVLATNWELPRSGIEMMAVMPTAKNQNEKLAMASFSLIAFHFAFYFVSAPSLGFSIFESGQVSKCESITGNSERESRSEKV